MTLHVDKREIERHLAALGRIGADDRGGVSRPSYSQLEREAHEYIAGQLQQLDVTVAVDGAGNTVGTVPGQDKALPPILAGSHLDTVPNGGRYDGAVGVVTALEAVRMLIASGVLMRHPIGVIIFAGEEGGSRFGEGRLGSQMKLGLLKVNELSTLRDEAGISIMEAMHSLGLRPERLKETIWREGDIAGFIEVHIEQGKILERLRKPIGVVTGIVAATRMVLKVIGRADHAGGTPMNERRDALVASAKMILSLHDAVRTVGGPGAVGNVGKITVLPGSVTVVPGNANMFLEIRDIEAEAKDRLRDHLLQSFREIAAESDVEVEIQILADPRPVTVPGWVQDLLVESCTVLNVRHHRMPSGGGHDAAHMAGIAPTGMIFTPCRDGISHNPAEFADVEDIAVAARVLNEALIRMDRKLSDSVGA